MAQNQNFVVVVRIWRMIRVNMKHNPTKFEEETQRWQPGTVAPSGGPR